MKLVGFNSKVFGALYDWHKDPEIRKSMGGMSVELSELELQAEYQTFMVGGRCTVYGVEAEKDGPIVGAFILDNIHKRHDRFDLHVVFGKGFERHAREATKLLLDFMFNENDFKWAHCVIPEGHEKIENLIKKVGAVCRCQIPEYFNFQDGKVAGNFYSLSKNKRKV